MRRKSLAVLMSVVLLLGSFGMAFGTSFSDMPDNWSTAALNKAVDNGLLSGYEKDGDRLIKANNPLTRAEMAAVINRAFASEKTADISKVSDVSSTAWYAKDMAKAVKMGTFAFDNKMRPGDKITRQEAFTVLARAFKLVGTDTNHKALNAFTDKKDIASWALDSLDGMAEAGYIQGSGGKLNPKANITRAEFAVVMDNLVKQYIDHEGIVVEVVEKGNLLVREAGVTLKDVTVKGDLIIADGVGEGDVILDNVKVEGRTVVRGGGENSIIITGNSSLGKVIVAKVDGVVRILVEDGAEVDEVYVDDGSDDVIVEGEVGILEVAGDDVTVTATKAKLVEAVVSGDNSKIVVSGGSAVNKGSITGEASTIVVERNSSVDTITISGPDATVEGSGSVKNVNVEEGGDGAVVSTPNTNNTVAEGVEGVVSGAETDSGGRTTPSLPQVAAINITAKVTEEVVEGPFDNDAVVWVILETDTEGAEIYYTLNGTPASANSEKYPPMYRMAPRGIRLEANDLSGKTFNLNVLAVREGYRDVRANKDFVFKAKEYTVTFKDYDGTQIGETQTVAHGSDATAPDTPDNKVGHAFDKWDVAFTNVTGDLTVTAVYKINRYTITFNTDGGTTVNPLTADYGASITSASNPTRLGYAFKGWNPNFPSTMPAENLVLTAQWERNEYTITYDLDGGTNDTDNPTTYTIETETITLKDATKANYTFVGWYDAQTDGSKVTSIDKGSTGNMTLYARFAIDTYTVTFKDHDGTQIGEIQTVAHGSDAIAPANPDNKEGYIFEKWDIAFTNVTKT